MKFTDEQIKEAEQKDLVAFAELHGYSFQRSGIYHKCNEHDSLVICGQKYFWNSQNKGGYGAISFARDFLDMDFQQAVKMLLNDGVVQENNYVAEVKKFDKNDITEVPNADKIFQYLLEDRCIDVDIIHKLISVGDIAQDKYNNVVFKWKNEKNEVVGADLKGTGEKRFTKIVSGSEFGKGFKIDNFIQDQPINNLVVLESPIDTLSYFQLHRFDKELYNTRFLSISGVKTNAIIEALKDINEHNQNLSNKNTFNKENFKVILGLDNDEAGNKAIEEFKNNFTNNDKIVVDQPKGAKDWNAKLQQLAHDKLHIYLSDRTNNRELVQKEINLGR
ncbi:DUF3991 and TOPRIM domain-containing protein [Macrococcoides caseolyticum]|uniref:DUF3991 and TOPRIM domain-containing protein n=1 Tax=Macrococcoides caseolyticum TaxID=69966 RepID=UPI001C5EFDAF|nr:DUF3991 and TOPRIM domain-containing protein [Macrococcus caseolyticus]QYA36561.1 DUF3991 and toprim domain-containing protein [Macrococcus caseolyticus]